MTTTVPHPMLKIAGEVRVALKEGRPVVALESTIISHGMPYPQNLEMAREVEEIIRDEGAVPATTAILQGAAHIGLTADQLETLATQKNVVKVSIRDLQTVMVRKEFGGTTVASAMRLASLAGIRLFATGGTGGVHRMAEQTMDISADLLELARTSVCVVCAGVKSILDIGLTLEVLETQGVPAIVLGASEFPAFFSRSSGFAAPLIAADETEAAHMLDTKWSFGLQGGVLLANPILPEDEIPAAEIMPHIEQALQDMHAKGLTGKETTPYLLARIVEITGGRSLKANIALMKNNARKAARVALAYAALQERR